MLKEKVFRTKESYKVHLDKVICCEYFVYHLKVGVQK